MNHLLFYPFFCQWCVSSSAKTMKKRANATRKGTDHSTPSAVDLKLTHILKRPFIRLLVTQIYEGRKQATKEGTGHATPYPVDEGHG